MKIIISTIIMSAMLFTHLHLLQARHQEWILNTNVVEIARKNCSESDLILAPKSIDPWFSWTCVSQKVFDKYYANDVPYQYISTIDPDSLFYDICRRRFGGKISILNRKDNILVCSK